MRKLWTLLLILTLNPAVFGFQRGNELFNIPVARMEPKGFLEIGGGVNGSSQSTIGTKTMGSIFFRTAFSDYIEYGLTSVDTSVFHHIQLAFEPIGTPSQSAHLAIGLRNIGWQRPTSPSQNPMSTLFGAFAATSFQFRERGAWIHAGIAESKFKNVAIGFVGLELETPIGRLSAEWDSEVYFFGIKTIFGGICQLSLGGTVRPNAPSARQENIEQFQIGISFLDPPVTQQFKEPAPLVRKKIASENAAIASANKAASLNAQLKIPTPSIATAAPKAKKPTPDTKLEDSLALMQKGNYYYYQGQFEEALQAYLKFIKLNPAVASGYTAVGSIYMQLGLKDEARLYWKRALELDPDNVQIKAYLQANKLPPITRPPIDLP